jgi:WD40 repeat protein
LDLDALEAIAASYSPDGRLFAVASDLGNARVWDAAIWKPVVTLGGFLNGAHAVSFSPDGKRLAVASDGKEAVRLWDTEGWQDVFTLEAKGTGFSGLAFSPDGNSIVWGNWISDRTTLYAWRAPSWAEIDAAEGKEGSTAR